MTVSTTEADTANTLARRSFKHPVISAVLDLDLRAFATPPARASEISSLIDLGRRTLAERHPEHADQAALQADLERVETFLRSEFRASGGHAVAVYCSSRADLFEAVELPEARTSEIHISHVPALEALIPPPEPAAVAVALINSRAAHLYTRPRGGRTSERLDLTDTLPGHHADSNLSEELVLRSADEDVEAHLRRAADSLHKLWQEEHFDRLVLAGPE